MDPAFLLKKVVAAFLYPLPLVVSFLVLGLLALVRGRRKMGGLLVLLGLALLLAGSIDPVSSLIAAPLERMYPPLAMDGPDPRLMDARWIVVLGGGTVHDPGVPAASRLGAPTLARLIEGLRLLKLAPGARLLVSGGAVQSPVSEARCMAETAVSLGLPAERITLDNESMDTDDQARILAPILAEEPFILVTSALHMPRSMILFRRQGLEPIPAPAGHLVLDSAYMFPFMFFPSALTLARTRAVVHEILGIAWIRLRGI